MKTITLNTVDQFNDFFRFDVRDVSYIEKNGFPASKGPDSERAEDTEKVFFSKGFNGVLDLIDVWLIWRLNRDNESSKDWIYEFLNEEYFDDNEKIQRTFSNMYEWLSNRKYYKVDLVEGEDYILDDVDEAKRKALKDRKYAEETGRKPWVFLCAHQMYKGKIKHFDTTMEEWNMHTLVGKGIELDKISLVKTSEGQNNAISVIEEMYNKSNNKNKYRLLDSFIKYCSIRRTIDGESNNIENNFQGVIK